VKVLDIAIKDLTRSFRSAIALAFMFVVPLLVTGMFYFMFGSSASSGEFELARIRVIIANLDRKAPRLQASSGSAPGSFKANTLSELIVEILNSEDLSNLLDVSLAEDVSSLRAAVDSQKAQVAIIIPEGFSRRFANLNETAEIEFYQDPTLTIGPAIVKAILNQFMDGLSGVKITANLAVEEIDARDASLIGHVIQEYLDTSVQNSDDLSADLLEVITPLKPQAEDGENLVMHLLGPILGGMMVFYAFYTGAASAESILREEEEGTLPRLFTTPTPQVQILAGKFLAVFLTVLVQVLTLLTAGRLIFGVHWGDLPAIALEVTGVVFCATSFGIFINSLLKSTRQGGLIFGGVLTLTGMIGMISIFAMNSPGAATMGNTVALVVPQGWATRGLLQMMNNRPVADLFLNTLVLLVWSALFFGTGVWRFNRRYA
jgi:ABC-2 type transport system permease protein